MDELEADRHELEAGAGSVVVVMIVFHVWRFVVASGFSIFKKRSVPQHHNAGEARAVIWGVTLPEILDLDSGVVARTLHRFFSVRPTRRLPSQHKF